MSTYYYGWVQIDPAAADHVDISHYNLIKHEGYLWCLLQYDKWPYGMIKNLKPWVLDEASYQEDTGSADDWATDIVFQTLLDCPHRLYQLEQEKQEAREYSARLREEAAREMLRQRAEKVKRGNDLLDAGHTADTLQKKVEYQRAKIGENEKAIAKIAEVIRKAEKLKSEHAAEIYVANGEISHIERQMEDLRSALRDKELELASK